MKQKPRKVESSYYRSMLPLESIDEGNAYGTIVMWDEANEKDIPVICEHGGSMWLCQRCADRIMQNAE